MLTQVLFTCKAATVTGRLAWGWGKVLIRKLANAKLRLYDYFWLKNAESATFIMLLIIFYGTLSTLLYYGKKTIY